MSDVQQRELVTQWLGSPAECDDFFQQVAEVQPIRAIMGVPLLATVTVLVYERTRELPTSRHDLYTKYVELLIKQVSSTSANEGS